jgi:voltage-gated sodium channel
MSSQDNFLDQAPAASEKTNSAFSYPALARLVDSRRFNDASLAMIIISAVILGFETDKGLYRAHQEWFHLLDQAILGVFTLEIGLRALARMPKPGDYLKDPWNFFDCAVVLVCYLPLNGQYAAVLRLLRVLRTLRLLTHIPRLRLIVETMLRSLSSMGYISLLLGLLFYIYGVIAVFAFGEIAPEYFGSLATAALTLFQIVTLEGWVEILDALKAEFPLAGPLFLISFIVLGTMIVLNLFIGVIVNSLAEAQDSLAAENRAAPTEKLAEDLTRLSQRFDRLLGAEPRDGSVGLPQPSPVSAGAPKPFDPPFKSSGEN